MKTVLVSRSSRFVFLLWTMAGVLGQTNQFQLHPFDQAPATFNGASGNSNSGNSSADPRAQSIADALRAHLAAKPALNPPADGVTQRLSAQKAALTQLAQKTAGQVEARFRKENGTPFQIKGAISQKKVANALRAALDPDELTARTFLRANRALLLINDPDQELVFKSKETDDLGRRHLRFAQAYKNIPVWPCELTVHLDPAGNVDLMDGAFVPTPAGLAIIPSVAPEDAVRQSKLAPASLASAENSPPELIIYGPLPGPARLAWKFTLDAGPADAWRVIVDALAGTILSKISLTPQAAETGSGVDGTGQTRPLNVWKDGNSYYLINAAKPMFDPTSTPPDANKTRGVIIILDAQNTPPTAQPKTFGDLVQSISASATSGWVPDAVGAAFGLSVTYDYYRDHHNRNSLDGQGGTIVGIVRLGVKFPNAFWNGQNRVMAFGDGYTRGIDVSGHELTHGVIDSVGNGGILEYHLQPGAINESLADIFGEMVETQVTGKPDWLMGEQLGAPLRNMADPGAIEWTAGRKYPAKMSEFVQLADSRDADEGGVHINSSIINHAYYLLAAGLKDALGLRDAERIFYRTMTQHLQKQSQFIDMRHGCLASAEELFGKDSTQVRKTGEAFDAVEILDAPVTPAPSPIPVVQGSDSTLALRYAPNLSLWYLVRREAAKSDPASGQLVETINFLSPRRVAVSGDGSFVVYVTFDNDVGIAFTDGSSAQLLGFPGTVYSIALSPDGSRFAFVMLDSFGNPSNQINVTEISTKKTRTIKLYAPGTEGAKLDIVQYADSMTFLPDGSAIIFDAYSEFKTKDDGYFGGWTLFGLNLATESINMLIDLNQGLDFGNPSLGKSRNYLLTYEIINKTNNLSSLYVGNLRTGETTRIGAMAEANNLGTPTFNGDDTAIIYAQVDHSTASGLSLVQQPLSPGSLNPAGAPVPWLSDAGFGAIYRRGAFVSSNTPPQVTFTSPAEGQTFTSSDTITLQATALDRDGTVAKVEFYAGSTKLGEVTTVPYSFAWSNVAPGQYRLIARAYDSIGGTADSAPVSITVTSLPPAPATDFKITSLKRADDSLPELTFNSSAGKNYNVEATTDFKSWKALTSFAATAASSSYRDAEAKNFPHRFYRVSIGSSNTSTNSTPALATMPEPGKRP